ncbi:DUF3093 domain-containing protein [Georgenia sp. Z1344]|uniref:DUF3093 domain-containing protein n=1 Tax=Georgenia sp. Z1344 TaxID=3416706 RepID=UPI003CE92F4E
MTSSPAAFRERLTPGPIQLVLAAGLGLSLALATLPFGAAVAVPVGVVSAVLVAVALWLSAPVVEVTADGPGAQGDEGEEGPCLRAGGAVIGLHHLGDAHVLDPVGMRAILGPRADARSFVVHRSWVGHGVVVVVDDDRDPTPMWVISTRRPDELAAALRSGQAAHSVQTREPFSS